MKRHRHPRNPLAGLLLVFSLLSCGTAAADGGLLSEVRNKALHGAPHATDPRNALQDRRETRNNVRNIPDTRSGGSHGGHRDDVRAYQVDHGPGPYLWNRHSEARHSPYRLERRHVDRHYYRYEPRGAYVVHDDDDDRLLFGILLGGLFGYAVGNAQPGYIYGQ